MSGRISLVTIFLVLLLISGCVAVPEISSIPSVPILTPEQQKIQICEEIAKQYHETHIYISNDIYDCESMACDVWDMLKAKGIKAKIVVGNVTLPEARLKDCNHAWVVAEISSDVWLAIECTGGYIVYADNNPYYYRGIAFDNPKSFRDR
jgi:hypothetical protein